MNIINYKVTFNFVSCLSVNEKLHSSFGLSSFNKERHSSCYSRNQSRRLEVFR